MLPSLSKVLERVLKKQMGERGMLFRFQSGFRSGYSTSTALLQVTNDIRIIMSKNLATVLMVLDFSKAFDSVSHSILLYKLDSDFGFSSDAIGMLKSYFFDRFQSVFVNGYRSNVLQVARGLPQDSILGLILFSIFINDLPSHLSHFL